MLVFVSVMVTLALATAAPVESDTVPSKVAFTAWPATEAGNATRKTAHKSSATKPNKEKCEAARAFAGIKDELLMTSPPIHFERMLTPTKVNKNTGTGSTR